MGISMLIIYLDWYTYKRIDEADYYAWQISSLFLTSIMPRHLPRNIQKWKVQKYLLNFNKYINFLITLMEDIWEYERLFL